MRKMKERIVSLVLTFVMVVSLFAGMAPMEVHAEDGATLTYEVVGGTGSMDSETLTADENFTLPEPSFTPDSNREFYGWIVYDKNELLEETGYINNTVLTVEAGENYKAIAYYGYRLTVQNLPNDTSIMYGSTMAKNPNPVVVPEFTGSMMEGNAFMISNSSMTSAPSFTGENGSAELVQSSDGQYLYLVKDITGPVTLVASSTPPAGETVAVTLDKSNFSGELYYCINEAASFEPVVENTINITTNDFLALASFGVEYEVTASDNGVSIDKIPDDAGACIYKISGFTNATTLTINPVTPTTDTYEITLDRTNYAEGYVDLYTYDSEGSYVANTENNNATITMPEGGKVRVFADSEFTVTAEGATISEMLSAGYEGYYYELTGIAADTTVVVNKVTTQEQTYELTIDCEGFTEDAPLTVIRFDSDGKDIDAIEVANGDKVEIPVGGSVMVTSTTPNFKVAVENDLADVSDLQQGDVMCGYVIDNIQGDITIVIESITQGGDPTYNITLDRTNYADGYVDLYTYNSEGSAVANTQDNNATITMPEGGKVRVFADSEFTVTAEGATISEMLSAGYEGYYYELTGIAADTTIVVNKGNTGNGDDFIDTVDVYFDWQEVPLLVNGSRELPSFSEATATVTVDGAEIEMISWGIKVTDSLKVTEEDDYYNEALATVGEENINAYNRQITHFGEVYGWAPLEMVLSNPYYKINENDVYAAYVAIVAEDGKCFGALSGDEYLGNLTCNVDVGCKLIDGDGEALIVFFELGTSDEMEEEKNGPTVEAPAITGQPQDATVEEGQKATFTVTATGDDLSYQWMIDRNDGKGFVNLNSTTATHTTTVVDMSCNGFKYKCIVSNSVGAVTSNVVTLTVTEKEVVHTHDLTLVPAKAATCTEEGNKAYYTCSGCDSLFTDAEGTKTTTAEAVKIAALGHDMTAATCKEPGVCKRSGCDHTVDALGHDWSGEWTIIKEATATEEGKKETYCTRKCGQKKVAVIPIEGEEEDDDNGNIEKDAEVDPEAPVEEATIDNKKDELLEGDIFTEEEKELIEAGEEARVWLEIGKTDEEAIASDDKAKIEKEATDIMGDDAKITYFDADLFKQVGNGEKTEITEPGVDIKITIVIPKELLNQDETINRQYKIIRLHEGVVDVISGTFDPATGEFSFETDRFSTYAIVYDDVPVDDDDDITDDDVDDGDEKDDVPDTGVVSTSAYAGTLMLLSGLGLVFCSSKKKSNE